MGRIYARGEKPHSIFSDRNGPNKDKRYFNLKVGRIVDIDYERYRFKMEWVTGMGSPEWVPMSFPYVGPGSCIGAMPELGSLAICGFLIEEGGLNPRPMCLGFLPVALQTALEGNVVKLLPDSLPNDQENLVFMRFRKLQKGDLVMASLYGGEVFVNRNVELRDGTRDTILIRSSDQSIISTSLNNFIFANGASVSAGQIIRNKIPIFDANGVRIPDQLAREFSLPDGRDNIYLIPFGTRIEENAMFYSEYRVDVDDLVNGSLETNDINNQSGLTNKDPIVSLIMGNYVGANETDNRYGKILRPILFNSPADSEGQFNLVECVQNKGIDEVANLGLAYAVHLLKKDSFFGFDKEGHLYLNLNASSTANPLGAGRSMSLLSTGNLKEVWGRAAEDDNSWDLSASGGVKWNIGQHNDQGNNRSIDIRTASSTYLEINGSEVGANDPDFNVSPSVPESNTKYSRQEFISGNQKVAIGGTEKKSVVGNSVIVVNGMRKEIIGGAGSYEYQTDKSENCMGVYSQVVIKEMQGRFGKRKETVLLGQELTVMTGDMVESIKVFGSKKTTLTSGSIVETILNGYKKINIALGGYILQVGVGNINLTAATGTVNVTGTAGVTIKSLKTDINSATVNIGAIPVRGGVVTSLTHIDYVTGLPLRGSMTVKASV
jgi:hypothetical protein